MGVCGARSLLCDENALEELAGSIAGILLPGDNILLTGPLGSGKSVFARAVLGWLGVKGGIPSPSFIVDAIYHTRDLEIHHIDLYRLAGVPEELEAYGVMEALDTGCLAVVEWADRLPAGIPGIHVGLIFTDDPMLRGVEVEDRRMARD
jgi:tRNA threonylcarbamoyladenosine biosynthesis protein TsaE